MTHVITKLALAAAIVVTAFSASSYASLALAQSDAPAPPKTLSAMEEVVGTAQRREELSQDVPMAITTLSEASLERQQIRNISQLSNVVPNFNLAPNTGTSSGAKIYMRAMGESESFFTADTPVGIYVDDVYIARQTGAMFDLFDIERVEVLRGPQGTLYGRKSWPGRSSSSQKSPSLASTTARGSWLLVTTIESTCAPQATCPSVKR